MGKIGVEIWEKMVLDNYNRIAVVALHGDGACGRCSRKDGVVGPIRDTKGLACAHIQCRSVASISVYTALTCLRHNAVTIEVCITDWGNRGVTLHLRRAISSLILSINITSLPLIGYSFHSFFVSVIVTNIITSIMAVSTVTERALWAASSEACNLIVDFSHVNRSLYQIVVILADKSSSYPSSCSVLPRHSSRGSLKRSRYTIVVVIS